ncbi:acetyl-CoA C-acyltransferase [Chromobacterium violaceum]|uniref:acetyl-CoA C-acyltransferase n=1 Tax=Chromobacterium violaceum TaxID=536 RepID=UPI001B33BD74|nr:acetyl-CoA C-acyltransferase [Chromobacterium violaceum]MBP4045710.1 acetyl-CoA C-acyltransferase [Chromobacterium violaceum]
MQQQEIVIVGMARTAMGGFQGALSGLTASQLGAAAIRAAVERAGVSAGDVGEVIMGCVLPAGQGQAPARQAALAGGLPQSTPCTTINKMCGSGMKALMMAHDQLLAGNGGVVVAGGMESMSNAPYLMPKARGGLRLGHGEIKDHMFLDGLEDAYQKGTLMGVFAEQCAEKYGFSRQDQDEFAIASLTRAQQAIKGGQFKDEIAAVTVPGRGGDTVVDTDEQPLKANLDKIPTLKPAFKKDGTVTPANSSSISDGGAALVLMTAAEAAKRSLKPIARVVGHSSFAHEPGWFTTAPVHAIEKLLAKTGWRAGEVDLYEINEAFAVVTMAAMHDLKLPHDKVNVHGGACALGHPIGASGARIVISLLSALKQRGGKRGVASLCIGGGEATALAVELI